MEERHDAGVDGEAIGGVDGSCRLIETDRLVVGDAVAHVVHAVERGKHVGVVVVERPRRTGFVGEHTEEYLASQRIVDVGVEVFPNAELHLGEQLRVTVALLADEFAICIVDDFAGFIDASV